MKKIFTKLFSILGITLLMAGVTACGNKQADQSKNSSVKTSKVEKSKNKASKTSTSKRTKKSSSSQESNNSSNSSLQNANDRKEISSSSNSTSKKTQSQKEIQLGLGDVATWTDENGITHHVDSDGMDRQTTSGSSQVTYKDWSGSLPSNAQVTHQN